MRTKVAHVESRYQSVVIRPVTEGRNSIPTISITLRPNAYARMSVALEAVPAHDRHGKLKAWLYGHTHTPGRRHVGDIEYVTQPRGFPDERRSRRLPAYRAARVTVTSR